MPDRLYTIDANMLLADATVNNPYVPTLLGMQTTVAGNIATIDLTGGGQTSSTFTRQLAEDTARFDGVLIVMLSFISGSSGVTVGNYRLTLQGTNPESVTGAMWLPALTQNLTSIDFGVTTNRDGLAMTTPQPFGIPALGSGNPTGEQYELLFTNDQNNIKYRYLRLWLTLLPAVPASATVGNVTPSTASPSIAFQAYIAPLP